MLNYSKSIHLQIVTGFICPSRQKAGADESEEKAEEIRDNPSKVHHVREYHRANDWRKNEY